MIPAESIISDFQRFYQERRGYIPGTSGETWTQEKQNKLAQSNETVKKYGSQWIGKKVDDCSGAFVDAYDLHGMSIYHGSNRIAREYVVELVPIEKAKPGYAIFKLKKPGQDGYQLPDEYKKGGAHYNGDLNDYYHIGQLDDDGKNVINAQSTSKGFTRTNLSLWHCAAKLKAVNYDENIDDGSDAQMEEKQAIVTADSGSTVNLRQSPSTKSSVQKAVKVGTIVAVTEEYNDEWAKIKTDGITGYMMRKYLVEVQDKADVVSIPRADLESIYYAIGKLLGKE